METIPPDFPNCQADPVPPWEPAWGWLPPEFPAWREQFADRLRRSHQGAGSCVLIGDSLTANWDGDHWHQHWGGRDAINLGISGDTTQHLLFRITHGQLAGLAPRTAVLLIGINNIWRDPYSPADHAIARGIVACARSVAGEWPHTHLVVLGLLPAVDRALGERLASINRLVAAQNLFGATHANLSRTFLTAQGELDPTCYQKDRVHLNATGYQRFAAALHPLLDHPKITMNDVGG